MMDYSFELKEHLNHGDSSFPMKYYESTNNDVYLHWHEEMEINYLKSGEGLFFIDSKSYKINQGDFILVPSGSIHSAKMTDGECCEFKTIVFSLEFLMSFKPDTIQIKYINPIKNRDFSFPIIISENNESYSRFNKCIFEIIECLNKREYGYEMLIKSLFYQLFFLLLMDKQSNLSAVERATNKIKNIEKIKQIVTYVQEYFDSPLTIQEVAQIIGINNQYFCHFFKKQTGQTFFQYLNGYRIQKAIYMLLNTNYSITEIAFKTGFEDLSYFIRTFKKLVLVSPSKYRKVYVEQINSEVQKI